MHFVYIIYSSGFNKYYVGESVNAEERTNQHNIGYYNAASTSFANDWVLKLKLEIYSKTEALKVERYIKSMKSKVFISRLINEPSFLIVFKQLVKQKFQIEIT